MGAIEKLKSMPAFKGIPSEEKTELIRKLEKSRGNIPTYFPGSCFLKSLC